jgi:hypothetical protein
MSVHERSRATREAEMAWDIVDVASALSFPASDPPAWATGQSYAETQADESPSHGERPDRSGGSSADDSGRERPPPLP